MRRGVDVDVFFVEKVGKEGVLNDNNYGEREGEHQGEETTAKGE